MGRRAENLSCLRNHSAPLHFQNLHHAGQVRSTAQVLGIQPLLGNCCTATHHFDLSHFEHLGSIQKSKMPWNFFMTSCHSVNFKNQPLISYHTLLGVVSHMNSFHFSWWTIHIFICGFLGCNYPNSWAAGLFSQSFYFLSVSNNMVEITCSPVYRGL